MGALERRALVSHKQERYCASLWVIMFWVQTTHTTTAKIEYRLQFDPSVDGEDNWRHNTVCTGCVWSWTNSQNLFDMLISNLYPILICLYNF
jgi:hypothetical protein